MSEPTTRFRMIPQATTVEAVNTSAERLAAIANQEVLSTGAGNEADFGTVDISGGAANSLPVTVIWDVTDDGLNTLVEDFMIWMSSNDFDIAATVCKFQPLSGADQGGASDTENYIANGVVGSYTWATMPEADPAAINLWPTNEGSSMVCAGNNGAADDVVMWAMYMAVGALETTGTYYGLTADFELQFSFKYSYS